MVPALFQSLRTWLTFFARGTCHVGDVCLAKFVVDQQPTIVERLAKGFRQLQQGLGDPSRQGQERACRQHIIGMAQPLADDRQHMPVDGRVLVGKPLEGGLVDEG